jgi:hypothetical protein
MQLHVIGREIAAIGFVATTILLCCYEKREYRRVFYAYLLLCLRLVRPRQRRRTGRRDRSAQRKGSDKRLWRSCWKSMMQLM